MKYQVIYESESGNTARVARAIAACLPEGCTKLVDINVQQPTLDADVYCVGFCVHHSICSMKMVELLELLSGKVVLLFATCGMNPTKAYRDVLERTVTSFLPDSCDYRGFFLCQGAISEHGFAALKRRFESNQDAETQRRFDEFRIDAHYHPDEKDLVAAREFVVSKIENGA